MFQKETYGLKSQIRCQDCCLPVNLDVHRSNAGFYLGFWCPQCGPISRETNYVGTRRKAEEELTKVRQGKGTEFIRYE